MSDKKVWVVNHQYGVARMFREREGYKVLPFEIGKDTIPDLVVFTGGADVNPQLYAEEPLRETHCDLTRDKEDIEAYKRFFDIPKVGICRGGQFLNVMSGGEMWQHVNNHGASHLMHNLLVIPGIEEKSMMVTSTHHQMMIAGNQGFVIGIAKNHENGSKGLATEYRSFKKRDRPDFDTEVVWYPETKSLCFQPHPEFGTNNSSEMREYFFKLVDHFFFN